jgi:hypothetical protein
MYTSKSGTGPWNQCQLTVTGVLSSKAMMVIMTAITLSLKASSRRGSRAMPPGAPSLAELDNALTGHFDGLGPCPSTTTAMPLDSR